jgi:nitrite reductase/ring-hydroxylating ferredoxin subunit
MNSQNTKIKIFLITGSLILCCLNCQKDSVSQIPYVSFNTIISANELFNIPIGSSKSFPGGNDSIYVYHADISTYYAYDRLCTYFPNDTSAIVTDIPGGATATCPHCKSKFELVDGGIIKGPARFPLKPYQATLLNGRLNIIN